jgi:serine/threonine protein kinase
MNRPSDLTPVDPVQRHRIQELLGRFEKAASGEALADLKDFLPSPEDPLRSVVLPALVQADLENHWRRQQRIYLEDYLSRFPELGTPQTVSAQLIYQEYCVRHRYGDLLEPATYAQRFPAQFPEFKRLLESQPSLEPAASNGTLKPEADDYIKTRVPSSSSGAGIPTLGVEHRETLPVGGGYTLIKLLGCGSFGEVWRAEAPGGVEVAVKIIHRPLDHEEAQRELQALELIKGLRHNYLLQTQAFWSLENQLLIVMDLADGSLRDRLKECQRQGQPAIPVEELVTYFREAGEALDFLHSKQVQHRDIKPDNILLQGRHVKVADFGLAKLQGTHSFITATVSGTPAYMAPEVWNNKIHHHSDQYSLAATYAELRLGNRLFTSDNLPALMFEHLQGTPDLTSLPEAEQKVLLRALAKEPAQRYPSCQDFAEALENALRPAPAISSETASDRDLGKRLPSLIRWSLVGLALVFMVGSLLALWAVGPGPSGSFSLVKPEPLKLAQGQTQTIVIHLNRTNFKEPIAVTLKGLPAGIRPTTDSMVTDADQVEVQLEASPDAVVGQSKVTVRAQAGAQNQEAVLDLITIFLPPQYEPAGQDTVEDYHQKQYYQSISHMLADGSRIDFLVIPKKRRDDLDTFYIMKHKVSVRQFRQFVKAHPELVKGQAWERNSDGCPALGVGVEEAYQFARWLQGNLPTTRQWDKAAGLKETPRRGKGPYVGEWSKKGSLKIAVGELDHPWELEKAVDDRSPFDCRDMAGNGAEWTRNLATENRKVPVDHPRPDALVWLRGRDFEAPAPLTYEDISDPGKIGVGEYKAKPGHRIGFRVVIELP